MSIFYSLKYKIYSFFPKQLTNDAYWSNDIN